MTITLARWKNQMKLKTFCLNAIILLLAFSGLLTASQPGNPLAYLNESFDSSVLKPSPSDQRIAEVVVRILEQHHFVRQQLDDSVSKRFLLRYLDNLDPMRIHFQQQDIENFTQKFATRLDDLTRRGDTSPAYEIYRVFLDRLKERVDFVRQQLEEYNFDFSSDERYNPERSKCLHPANIEESRKLWYNRLKYEVLQEHLSDIDKKVIVEKLLRRYSRILRMARETEPQDVLGIYLSSLTHVYDPHSEYLNASRLDSFEINMRLSLTGIGAVLGSDDGYCVIRELVPGGPAEISGLLKPGDRIVGVAQEGESEFTDVVDMHLNRVVNLIRGEPGSQVRLLISPADSKDSSITKVITLTRDHIKITQNEAKAAIYDLSSQDSGKLRIGVIDLPSFYGDPPRSVTTGSRKSTTQDVKRLITRLKKERIQGLILDLRRNGGGYLEEAINLTGLFIPPGPAVQVQDARGRVEISRTSELVPVWDGPLVLLLSRFSASASEILANALKDHGRAVLVGDLSTHGKGTVQTLIDIDSILDRVGRRSLESKTTEKAGGLKITVQKFYGPDGSSTQLRGVTPDIVLPSINDYMEIGEASLQDPLPWDILPPAYYKKDPRITAEFLPILRAKSAERVNNNPDFKYIKEDIEIMREQLKDKSISLNETQRRKERELQKQLLERRYRERRERISQNVQTVILLTLADLENNKLPEPVLLTAGSIVRPFTMSELSENDFNDETNNEQYTNKPQYDHILTEAQNILLDLIVLIQASNKREVDTNTLASNPPQTPKKKAGNRL